MIISEIMTPNLKILYQLIELLIKNKLFLWNKINKWQMKLLLAEGENLYTQEESCLDQLLEESYKCK